MAVVQSEIKGQILVYEESVRDEIVANIKSMYPTDYANPDVNILDVAVFLAANAYKAPNKKIQLAMDGFEILFDGTTNSIGDNADSLEEWMRGFTAAVAGGVVGFIVGGTTRQPVIAFSLGNSFQSWFLDNIWDVWIGASYKVFDYLSPNEDITKLFKSASTIQNTTHDIEAREDMLHWITQSTENVRFQFKDAGFKYFVKGDNAPKIEYASSDSIDSLDLKEILKVLPKHILPIIRNLLLTFYMIFIQQMVSMKII